MRPHVLSLSLLLLAAGCPALDAGQPIVLDPADDWTPNDVEAVQRAAECWNLQFGTRLVLPGDVGWSQHVAISFNDFVCVFAMGQTNPTLPVTVQICRPDHFLGYDGYKRGGTYSRKLLFVALLHELGHVLNIRRHADDPLAVMAGGWAEEQVVPRRFAAEDRQLFHEANGELEGGCDVAVDPYVVPPSCSCVP